MNKYLVKVYAMDIKNKNGNKDENEIHFLF